MTLASLDLLRTPVASWRHPPCALWRLADSLRSGRSSFHLFFRQVRGSAATAAWSLRMLPVREFHTDPSVSDRVVAQEDDTVPAVETMPFVVHEEVKGRHAQYALVAASSKRAHIADLSRAVACPKRRRCNRVAFATTFPTRCGLTGAAAGRCFCNPLWHIYQRCGSSNRRRDVRCLAPCRIFRRDIRVRMAAVHLRHASPRSTPLFRLGAELGEIGGTVHPWAQ